MKNYLITFCMITFLGFQSIGQTVTKDILQSVFNFKYGNEIGSCFEVVIDSTLYLVTARHLLPDVENKSIINISIARRPQLLNLDVIVKFHNNPDVDIALLEISKGDFDVKKHKFDNEYYITQDCYILGFPNHLGLNDPDGSLNAGFRLPFVKKGIISSMSTPSNGIKEIYLDVHNNRGFSGGPVVVSDTSGNSIIIGVIRGYFDDNITITINDQEVDIKTNSGIAICQDISYIFEIIDQS